MPQNSPPRLVIVEDEPDIRGMVADHLARDGYVISACQSGAELDAALASAPADLVILDVSLPGEDGFSIARRLQAAGPMPVLMLTALCELPDRVAGLEVGADDYMTKPFDLRELGARVRAVLRRSSAAGDMQPAEAPQRANHGPRICFGKVTLDLASHCLIDREGAELQLTSTEFDLLAAFARNPNRILSRDRLLDVAWVRDRDRCDRAVDIRVTRIRKKIEVDPARPCVIRTVRSAGYMYVPPPASA